jgi:hypothetical protein
MSDIENSTPQQDDQANGQKKVSLKDAVKQKLAAKKQQQPKGNATANSQETKKMSSQQTKKNMLQRRKMGG